jgi:hypothetical protein
VNPKLPTPGEISLGDLVTELGGSLHPLERPRVRFTTEGGFRLEPW